MRINTQEIIKTLKHAALLGVRALGIYATYQLFFAGTTSNTNSEQTEVLSDMTWQAVKSITGVVVTYAQAPGIFNQFRHFGQHLTAISDDPVSKKANQLAHQVPHVTGIRTQLKSATQKLKIH
mgnify:CR=1 FL=1